MDYCLHLYCYFHDVLADMSSGLLQVFVELRNLHRTSNYVLYWIHGVRLQASNNTGILNPVIANGIRTGKPCGFNKGCSLKFREGSWVWQTPEEGWRTYQPKCCRNNNKDEDNSPKTLNYIHQFRADIWCHWEDSTRVMANRHEWWERIEETFAVSRPWW